MGNATNGDTHPLRNERGKSTARAKMFRSVMSGYMNRGESWDGYQKNPLLMNLAGKGFVNIAFLMGVSAEYDYRAVVSDDLDADGKVDLLVVAGDWRNGRIVQSLHVYRNRLKTDHHWIGVRLAQGSGGNSPLGAKVTILTSGRKQVGRIVTGDSISAQHPATLHFGLGRTNRVRTIEVRFIGGKIQRAQSPTIDQYHVIRP